MITLEVCCGGFADAAAAQKGGASRVELNSALSLGGLTPDIGSLVLCKEELEIPVVAMVRPRGGGFCYTQEEYSVMKKSAEVLLREGADGLAFGFLTKEREVDEARTREFVEQIHAHGREAVFHRAFDCVVSMEKAVEALISAGVDRLLTSGMEDTALHGMECLRKLQDTYGQEIEILAGAGIRCENVGQLLSGTGVRQVHSSCKGYGEDRTARGAGVQFDYAGIPQWYCYEVVAEEEVVRMRREISKFVSGPSIKNAET